MVDLLFYITKLGTICFYFLIGEIILFLIFEQCDKGKVKTVRFRPFWYNLVKGTKMSPYIDTMIYCLIFIIFLVTAYFLSLSENNLIIWVQKMNPFGTIGFSLISFCLVLFWVAKIEFDRAWKNKAVWIPLTLCGIIIAISLFIH